MDQQAALGAAVALIKGGEVIYSGGFGTTTVAEHGVKVTPRTLFYYGSICKTLCATLIMRLVEQRQLALDTPIVHYLPDLHFSNPTYGQKVTLRHLLSHTSGLPDLPLWQTYEGLYQDPSNTNPEEIFRIRVQDGVLLLAENEQESPCKALSNRQFLSDLIGSFEFVDTDRAEVKLLLWGKATRYFPVDQQEYRTNRVIKYLADIPNGG